MKDFLCSSVKKVNFERMGIYDSNYKDKFFLSEKHLADFLKTYLAEIGQEL